MTFDPRTEKNLKSLDPKAERRFRLWFEDAHNMVADLGYDYRIISGNRTYEEQNELYKQGRTKPGKIVTYAKGGQSNHNFRIAIDCGVFKNGDYIDEIHPDIADVIHEAVAADADAYGIDWGGHWSGGKQDKPHFEISTSLSLPQKRAKYESKGSVL